MKSVEPMRLTDTGNGERLINMFRDEIRYCPPMNAWFIWDGRHWIEDIHDSIFQMAKQVARSWLDTADACKDEQKRSRIARWAVHSESLNRLDAMIKIARTEDDVGIMPNEMDRNPMTLNVLNGTIDLETMKLLRFNPGDLITKLAPVVYTRGVESRKWLKFLSDVLPDTSVRDFIQAAVGYSLTASMKEDKLFILYGNGCNGKTTFTGALLNMLGDYGVQASSHAFTGKGGGGPSNDIFALMGSRFVAADETGESSHLNEALIKQMTGGGMLSINPKYRHQIEFYPTWKIWLSTNHLPLIEGNDDAIWRRLINIPFCVRIRHVDRGLKPYLLTNLSERSGILNWALEGVNMWRRAGLIIPGAIASSTDWYRVEQDLVGQFIHSRCELHPRLFVSKIAFYREYSNYCREVNEKPKSQNMLGRSMNARGIKDVRESGCRYWSGIGISNKVSLHPSEVI